MMEYDNEVVDEIDDSDLDALSRPHGAPQNGEHAEDDEEEEDTEDETEEDEDEEAEDEDEEDVEKNSSPRRSSRLNPKKSEKETKEQISGDMKTKKEMIKECFKGRNDHLMASQIANADELSNPFDPLYVENIKDLQTI